MKTVYEDADDLNAKKGEDLLKSYGLRAVEVMCLICVLYSISDV